MTKTSQMKVALWLIPVIFGAGGFYSMVVSASAHLGLEVVAVKKDLDEHVSLEAHPVTKARLEVLVTEQRAIRSEQKDQGEAIAAICAATNARCP